jgi:hypothetical protein
VGLGFRFVFYLHNFCAKAAFVLQPSHDVAWFDVAVDELLFVNSFQAGGYLGR